MERVEQHGAMSIQQEGLVDFLQQQQDTVKPKSTTRSDKITELTFPDPFNKKTEGFLIARSDNSGISPGLHDAGKYEYKITPDMIDISNNIVDAFYTAQMGGKKSLVNNETAFKSCLPVEGHRYLQLSRPPMSDFSWQHYELARLTNDPRLNPEHRNYEKLLMETLEAHHGPISQEYLTKAALLVSTDGSGHCDKELAVLLLNNFSKNVAAVVRRDSQWGYHVSEHKGNSFPSNTYSDDQVDGVWNRLQGLGNQSASAYDRAGRFYHLYGAMFAQSISDLLGSGVYVERVMRASDGSPHDPEENGAGVIGRHIGKQLITGPTPTPQPGPPSIW